MLNWLKQYWANLALPAKIYFGLGIVSWIALLILMIIPSVLYGYKGIELYLIIFVSSILSLIVMGLIAKLISWIYSKNKTIAWIIVVIIFLGPFITIRRPRK